MPALLLVAMGGCATTALQPMPADRPAGVPQAFEVSLWSQVLRENVRDELVDYEHLKDHREPLHKFLGLLSVVGPETHPELFKTRGDRAAYWINAYNALVLRIVLERYPTESMYDLGAPDLEGGYSFPIDGRVRTLLQIRDSLLEEAHRDVRVLFCLCAAARGCPPLAAEPYHGLDLERRLREVARAAMNNEAIVRMDNANRRLLVWIELSSRQDQLVADYEARFQTKGAGLLTVLNSLADAPRRSQLSTARGYRIGSIPFDRALNAWKPG